MLLKKYIVGMMFPIILLLSSSLFARTGVEQVDRIYDFGVVGIGYDVFHDYKIVNHESAPLKLDSVFVRCDCSTVSMLDTILSPGDTGTIRLHFNTENYYGRISKAIKVHTSSKKTPYMEYYYLTTVGQYLMGLKPSPTSLFFLPKKGPITVTIPNIALDEVKIIAVEPYNDFITTEIVKERASKGDSLELIVSPVKNLKSGTFLTNFRLSLELGENFDEPLYISIPVKIVVY